MSDISKILSHFVDSERERFEIRHNNMFAFSFSQITRYADFLLIILKRYEIVGNEFSENTKIMHEPSRPGSHQMTKKELEYWNNGIRLISELHLEIESFYLFAKILLDKIARSIEFYFGQVNKKPLDSHDDLTKNLSAYSVANDLTLSNEFLENARIIKSMISDFRDKQIAHEKSPRTMWGTIVNSEGYTKMSLIRLYPTEKDGQVDSATLHELFRSIEQYVAKIVDFLRLNREKTNLDIDLSHPA